RDRNVTGVQTCALPIFPFDTMGVSRLETGHAHRVEGNDPGRGLGHVREDVLELQALGDGAGDAAQCGRERILYHRCRNGITSGGGDAGATLHLWHNASGGPTMATEEEVHEGSCCCGRVRFRVTGPFGTFSHCHCTDCRKSHGAAFASYIGIARARFTFLEGESEV